MAQDRTGEGGGVRKTAVPTLRGGGGGGSFGTGGSGGGGGSFGAAPVSYTAPRSAGTGANNGQAFARQPVAPITPTPAPAPAPTWGANLANSIYAGASMGQSAIQAAANRVGTTQPTISTANATPIGVGGGSSSVGFSSASPSFATDVPAAPVIPDATADATYQTQIADLAKALADFQSQRNLSLSQYDTNYNDGLHNLGWDSSQGAFDPNNMQGLYGQAQDNNRNDFGSRGLLRSGLYAQSLGNLDTDFTGRKTSLDTARGQYRDTQDSALSTYQSQQQLAQQAALREAVARIAAQYGVDPSAVPGQGKTA